MMNDIYPLRRGYTLQFMLDITFSLPLDTFSDEDFTVEISTRDWEPFTVPFVRVGGRFTCLMEGVLTKSLPLGNYNITLWYHYGTDGQVCLDFKNAFKLIPFTI